MNVNLSYRCTESVVGCSPGPVGIGSSFGLSLKKVSSTLLALLLRQRCQNSVNKTVHGESQCSIVTPFGLELVGYWSINATRWLMAALSSMLPLFDVHAGGHCVLLTDGLFFFSIYID